MPLSNTATRYGTVASTLHWLTALMILALIPLGLIATGMEGETAGALATQARLYSVHKTLGVAVFLTALVRLFWAVAQPKPAPLHPERRLQTFLADAVHWTLYGALIVVPISGWMHHAATEGFAPILWPFGQELPFVPVSERVAGAAAALHWLAGRVLMAALVLHVAGAVKHALIDLNGILGRMGVGTVAGSAPVSGQRSRGGLPVALLVWGVVLAVALVRVPETQAVGPVTGPAPVVSGWQVGSGSLTFRVTQFGKELEGRFSDWTAAIEYDPETGTGEVDVRVRIASLTIGSVTTQALGPLHFDAAGHPEARFVAKIAPNGEAFVADGTLSLKGREVPVVLPFALEIDDGTARMEGVVRLDRRDFGIGDPGDATLGSEVVVEIELAATR